MFVAAGGVAVSILGSTFSRQRDAGSQVSPFHPISLGGQIYSVGVANEDRSLVLDGHTTPNISVLMVTTMRSVHSSGIGS